MPITKAQLKQFEKEMYPDETSPTFEAIFDGVANAATLISFVAVFVWFIWALTR